MGDVLPHIALHVIMRVLYLPLTHTARLTALGVAIVIFGLEVLYISGPAAAQCMDA